MGQEAPTKTILEGGVSLITTRENGAVIVYCHIEVGGKNCRWVETHARLRDTEKGRTPISFVKNKLNPEGGYY